MAFLLLVNANVESSQRISVLDASSPRMEDCDEASTTDDFLKAVSISSIASVIQRFDAPRCSADQPGILKPMGTSSEARSTRPPEGQEERTLNLSSLLESRPDSHIISEGRKAFEHLSMALRGTPQEREECRQQWPKGLRSKKTVTFNVVNLAQTDTFPSDFIGPLLDEGAPYTVFTAFSVLHTNYEPTISEWKQHFVCRTLFRNVAPIKE